MDIMFYDRFECVEFKVKIVSIHIDIYNTAKSLVSTYQVQNERKLNKSSRVMNDD